MTLTIALCGLVGLLVVLGVLEYLRHSRNLAAIPIRIHVNGTRGKSSVVRLIAGALRAHGLTVVAKTTGSLPRVILPDASELPLYRPGQTNVIEQLRITSLAANAGADALVLECMALQPRLQSLTELMMVRSTLGVITNARPDHLDVMGPTEHDVALALLGTCPAGTRLFTAEQRFRGEFEAVCADRGTQLVAVGAAENEAISDEEMARFSYVEHRENVALSLAVASAAGVPRDVALEGMLTAAPDIGALREFEIDFFGRRVMFINGFAANDPDSTERIWKMVLERHPWAETRVFVVNCRVDRPDRTRQLGDAIPRWHRADHYFLVGSGTYAFARRAVAAGLPLNRMQPLEGENVSTIFEEIMGECGRRSVVVGVGNIAGDGLELLQFFQNRSMLPAEGGAA